MSCADLKSRATIALFRLFKRPMHNLTIKKLNSRILSSLRHVDVTTFLQATPEQLALLRSLFHNMNTKTSDATFARELDDTLHGTVLHNTMYLSASVVEGMDHPDMQAVNHSARIIAHELLHWLRASDCPEVSAWAASSEDDADKSITVREEQLCFYYQDMLDGKEWSGPATMAYVRERLIGGKYVTAKMYNTHKRSAKELLALLDTMQQGCCGGCGAF